jgi:PAS domain S-box-containing protein
MGLQVIALETDKLAVAQRLSGERAAQHYAAIVESSTDAILSKDLNGVITSWNRGAQLLFGYTAEEAVGQPVTLLIPADRYEEEPFILGRIRRGESVEHYETIRRTKDGRLLDISLTVSPSKMSAEKSSAPRKSRATFPRPSARRSARSFFFARWTIASKISSRLRSAFCV